MSILCDSVNRFFAPDGPLAVHLPGHETRFGQLELAISIAKSLESGSNLVAEAGTGTGKSLAYLVPAIFYAEANPTKQILISTKTIALQDQLLNKDIPLIKEILKPKRSIIALKGRGNYLSIRRMNLANDEPQLFHEMNQYTRSSLKNIKTWAGSTVTGEKADLHFDIDESAWELARSDWQNCRYKKCPNFKDCFYFKAVQKAASGGILIVNHALLFTKLAYASKVAGAPFDFSAAILDEAHEIEDAATEQFSMTFSERTLPRILRRLDFQGTDGAKGILALISNKTEYVVKVLESLARAKSENGKFFLSLAEWFEANRGSENHAVVSEWPTEFLPVQEAVSDLTEAVRGLFSETAESIRAELESVANRLSDLNLELNIWFHPDQRGQALWMEENLSSKGVPYTELKRAPLEVGPILKQHLFKSGRPVLMTSATIAIDNSFDYFRDRVGLVDPVQCHEIQIDSPFHYDIQMKLELFDQLPDPSRLSTDSWIDAIVPQIMEQLDRTEGGILILFTNTYAMRLCHSRLFTPCRERQRRIFMQGRGAIGSIIENFRTARNALLLGVDSLWQGIDVRGNALERVIIPRLPFESPNNPLASARSKNLKESGGNYFMQVSIPRALVKLKQGWGRLIRSLNDKGTISILDPRLFTKRFGYRFLNSIPSCQTFLNGLPWDRR